jgi:thiamine kinase-like enzyme
MDLKEERNMILDMIAEGKISVEEAKQLLDALEQSAAGDDTSESFFDAQDFGTSFDEMRMPNIPRIVNRATQKAYRRMQERRNMDPTLDGLEDAREDLEDAREDLEDELQRMREELKELQKEAERMRKAKDKE